MGDGIIRFGWMPFENERKNKSNCVSLQLVGHGRQARMMDGEEGFEDSAAVLPLLGHLHIGAGRDALGARRALTMLVIPARLLLGQEILDVALAPHAVDDEHDGDVEEGEEHEDVEARLVWNLRIVAAWRRTGRSPTRRTRSRCPEEGEARRTQRGRRETVRDG